MCTLVSGWLADCDMELQPSYNTHIVHHKLIQGTLVQMDYGVVSKHHIQHDIG